MIHRVSCNQGTFREVEFSEGMNVVLADRTREATPLDSRNGLGKSTLIEIIHFCLGSKASKEKGLLVEPLMGWAFTLDMTLAGKMVSVTRATNAPGKVTVDGDTSGWPVPPTSTAAAGKACFSLADWNSVLGAMVFGLEVADTERKYQPTFRSLISHFVRRGRDAFSSPFDHHRRQREWQRQVVNCFLLGLAWEDASDWQVLKDREKLLNDLRRAARAGMMADMLGTLGELEAAKVRLEAKAQEEEGNLATFTVHPQYREIQERANQLTAEMHHLANENIADDRLLKLYEASVQEERAPSQLDVATLYAEAGIVLAQDVRRQLDQVVVFHQSLIANRRRFLASETERLRRTIAGRDALIKAKDEERASLMVVLETHGALEEYTRLQQLHAETLSRLGDVQSRMANLRRFEEGRSALRIERELLQQRARADYDEREAIRERAISLFNANSQALYEAPGTLVIDIGPSGFQFGVEIERSGSQGISSMKVFCYDLMLAQLWADRTPSPGFLVHDSTIFDGVDERQVAHALELAAAQSKARGFQYICALNSDAVPQQDFSSGFDLQPFVRLCLTDATSDGGLLGIRF